MCSQQPDFDSLSQPWPSSVPLERILPSSPEHHSLHLQNRDQSLFLQCQPLICRAPYKTVRNATAVTRTHCTALHGAPLSSDGATAQGVCAPRHWYLPRAWGGSSGSLWSLRDHVFPFRQTAKKEEKGLLQKSPKLARKVHVRENRG